MSDKCNVAGMCNSSNYSQKSLQKPYHH